MMGQGLSLAWAQPEVHVFWKAWSPTFGEGPVPEQARSPTFGEGPKNPSFLTAVHSKIPRPGIHGRAQAWAGPRPDSSNPGLDPGPTFQGPTHH